MLPPREGAPWWTLVGMEDGKHEGSNMHVKAGVLELLKSLRYFGNEDMADPTVHLVGAIKGRKVLKQRQFDHG